MPDLRVIEAEPPGALVIERLKEALEAAEAGQISSIGIAVVNRDGSVNASWSDAPSYPMLLGAVHRLAHKIDMHLDD
jgi:hypothetical protein